MKTTNKTIEVKANHRERTFTIRTKHNGVLSCKFRTNKMSKEEFESSLYQTQNDWQQYLNGSQDYYLVK